MNHYYRLISIQSSYAPAAASASPQAVRGTLALVVAGLTSGSIFLLLG